ncbi:hypothetical protein OUZ56_032068 [Daphnia magna]|uniref:Uncharacterized protein n=1 Tax=Daphnia magna TaxID=35525 RepID=A0ABQ9ZW18_9CRUS|nr:hypothetical protein OUZ56_032068 [Daphnia magna]
MVTQNLSISGGSEANHGFVLPLSLWRPQSNVLGLLFISWCVGKTLVCKSHFSNANSFPSLMLFIRLGKIWHVSLLNCYSLK